VRLQHVAQYRRQEVAYSEAERVESLAEAQAFHCLVEPMAHRARESVAATITDPRFVISWRSPELFEGDVVEWQGEEYTLKQVIADTLRGRTPYYTAILVGTYV